MYKLQQTYICFQKIIFHGILTNTLYVFHSLKIKETQKLISEKKDV